MSNTASTPEYELEKPEDQQVENLTTKLEGGLKTYGLGAVNYTAEEAAAVKVSIWYAVIAFEPRLKALYDLQHKIDWRMVPLLVITFALTYYGK